MDNPPVAAFTHIATGLTVNFDASTSTDDGSIIYYSWDFGDDALGDSATATISHTYTDPGTYDVTLLVLDNRQPLGQYTSITHQVTVTTTTAAQISCTVGVVANGAASTSRVVDYPSGVAVNDFLVLAWGAGQSASLTAPAGWTKDPNADISASTISRNTTLWHVAVAGDVGQANKTFTQSSSPSTAQMLNFKNVDPADPFDVPPFEWASTSSEATTTAPTATATVNGAVAVYVVTTSGTATWQGSVVTSGEGQYADWQETGAGAMQRSGMVFVSAPMTVGQQITPIFTPSVSRWATGVGFILNPATGNPDPPNEQPSAAFTFTTNNLVASFTDGSSDSDGTVVSRAWAFGDGGTSTATNPVRTYASAGTRTVTLTVTDNDGATDQATRQVTVTSGGSGGPGTLNHPVRLLGDSMIAGALTARLQTEMNARGHTVTIQDYGRGGDNTAQVLTRFRNATGQAYYICWFGHPDLRVGNVQTVLNGHAEVNNDADTQGMIALQHQWNSQTADEIAPYGDAKAHSATCDAQLDSTYGVDYVEVRSLVCSRALATTQSPPLSAQEVTDANRGLMPQRYRTTTGNNGHLSDPTGKVAVAKILADAIETSWM